MATHTPVTNETITPPEEQKWIDAVNQLTRLTHQGTIRWTPVDTAEIKMPGKNVISAYKATHEGRLLLLRETTDAPYDPDKANLDRMLSRVFFRPPEITQYEQKTFSLLIVDANLSPLFLFPRVADLIDLVAAIKYQMADVDSFLDSLRTSASAGPMGSAVQEKE